MADIEELEQRVRSLERVVDVLVSTSIQSPDCAHCQYRSLGGIADAQETIRDAAAYYSAHVEKCADCGIVRFRGE